MVFNTISVGTAVTPTVIETYFSHYLNRKTLRQKPTAHISYHEGLRLIRRFLLHASYHTVEDIQGFTSQWVPNPPWVRVDEVTIPQNSIADAADAIIAQLGHKGIDKVGGSKWWQWRREGSTLKAEWIEMKADYDKWKQTKHACKRIMLYVHGGAYYFGSVDEHRYQIQRHARKLGARVLARVLVILREQGISLPAGAILISPWVDLTHSFPSVAGDASLDYIPVHGFLSRPSAAWPPPNTDDMEQIALHAVDKVVGEGMPRKSNQHERQVARDEAVQGFSAEHKPDYLDRKANNPNPAATDGAGERPENTVPGSGHDLSIMLNGKLVTIKDQIQMYATNRLISHPLVSPVLQPSLGGLPPLLILTGGGEMLRDEQIYLAHKAANPAMYPPGEAYMSEYPDAADLIAKYKPTDVQLQVWDDLCHVAPTLSFTRPAKYMYRSIAQFGAWALAKAQKIDIDIMDDDAVSVISFRSDTDSGAPSDLKTPREEESTMKNGVTQGQADANRRISKAGEPLPAFKNHMIRQRVDRHGNIYPLGPPSSLPALKMSSNEIGVIKPGPVRKWMEAKKSWDNRFAKDIRMVQKQRIEEMAKGYQGFGDDEVPPPSALASRRGLGIQKEPKRGKSWGMSLWSIWGSSHDEKTIKREEKADKEPETTTATTRDTDTLSISKRPPTHSRSRSRRRVVSYTGQSEPDMKEATAEISPQQKAESCPQDPKFLSPTSQPQTSPSLPSTTVSPLPSPSVTEHMTAPIDTIAGTATHNRPARNGKAFPFKLSTTLQHDGTNASTFTLKSVGLGSPMPDEGIDKRLGYGSIITPTNKGDEVGNPKHRVLEAEKPQMERFETARSTL
ncbi:MAG: hypothetical protein Q9213_000375 [Squamulea squamosa]